MLFSRLDLVLLLGGAALAFILGYAANWLRLRVRPARLNGEDPHEAKGESERRRENKRDFA